MTSRRDWRAEREEVEFVSYQPEVQRVSSAKRTRERRRASRRQIAWLLIVPPLALAIGVTVFFLTRSLLRSAAPEATAPPPSPIVYVTATLPPTAIPTGVLPEGYLISLSATPPPPPQESLADDPLQPTFTPAFAAATPEEEPFSLANSLIVYVCFVNGSDEICLMNGDGSNVRQLTDIPGTDWYPAMSPDGSEIIFSSQNRTGPFNIFVMDLEGGNLRQLTRDMNDNYAPEISPDGTRVVFTSTYGENGDQNIWVMGIDGSNPTQVTFHLADDIDPSWSPDGRQISFASNRSGTKELFIMNADGTGVQQLTNGVSIGGRNDWSPDSNWLTFYAGPGSDKDIFIIPIECKDLIPYGCDRSLVRQLTDGGNNKGPAFSPDGEWITFASSRDGDNEIFIMRIDGSDVKPLNFNTFADWQPRWGLQP